MTGASSVTVASGLRLSYAERGGGPSAVVFLPGPTDSWRSYQPVLDRLPESLRAVAVSQRGHGDSDKPDAGYRIEDFAADAVSLLDELGIERAVLAGHSGSCFVVRRLALDHPHRVAGLVLEASPTTLRGDPGLREFVESVVSPLSDPISPDFVRSFVTNTSSDDLDPELLDQLVDELLKVPARAWHEMFEALLEYDDLALLGGVSSPALLLWGDGDALVSREMQDQLVASLPEAHLLVYPGVGHTPRVDDPTRFSNDVTAFVEDVLGSTST